MNSEGLRLVCDFCVSRKRRCNGSITQTCSLCAEKGKKCTFRQRLKRGPKPLKTFDKPKHVAPPSLKRSSGSFTESDRSENSMSPALVGKSSMSEDDESEPLQESSVVRSYFTPSPAMGLVGLQENEFLVAFVQAEGRNVPVSQEAIGIALAGIYRGRSASVPQDSKTLACMCSLWMAISCGAMYKGLQPDQVTGYVSNGCNAISMCQDQVSMDVLEARVNECVFLLLTEDFENFSLSLEIAINVGKALWEQRLIAMSKAANGEIKEEDIPEPLAESVWYQLQVYLVVAQYYKRIKEAVRDGKSAPDPKTRDWNSTPFRALMSYAPVIDEIAEKTDPDDTVQQLMEDRLIEPLQAWRVARANFLSQSLTELSHITLQPTDVSEKTRSTVSACLQQVCMGIHFILIKIAERVVYDGAEAARSSAEKLSKTLDNILTILGDDFLLHARGEMLQIIIILNSAFLKLLLGKDQECLKFLHLAYDNIMLIPGCIRVTVLRHNYHWVAAALSTAGSHERAEALAVAFNRLNLRGGECMPRDAEDIKRCLCACQTFPCRAVHLLMHGRKGLFGSACGVHGAPCTSTDVIHEEKIENTVELPPWLQGGGEKYGAAALEENLDFDQLNFYEHEL